MNRRKRKFCFALICICFIQLPTYLANAANNSKSQKDCMMSGALTPVLQNYQWLHHEMAPDGKTHLFYDQEPTRVYKVVKENGQIETFPDKDQAIAKLFPKGIVEEPWIESDKNNKKIVIHSGSSKQEIRIPEKNWSDSFRSALSADKSTLVVQFEQSFFVDPARFTVINLKTKEQKGIEVPNVGSFLLDSSAIHPKGKFLALPNTANSTVKVDLSTGKIKTRIEKMYTAKYYSSGRICGQRVVSNTIKSDKMFMFDYDYVCIDEAAGEESAIPLPLNMNEHSKNTYYLGGGNVVVISNKSNTSDVALLSSKEICSDKVQVDCGCDVPKPGNGSVPGISALKAISLEALCKADSSPANKWDQLTGPIKSKLTEKEGLLWLKRFVKPDGLNLNLHLGILRGLIEANFAKTYPDDMAAALSNLANKSEYLFGNLLAKYPRIVDLKLSQNPQVCRSDSDKKVIKQGVYSIIMKALKSVARPNLETFSDFAWLVNLNLDADQRESLATVGAEKLVETTADTSEARDIFSSKIYKFSLHKLKQLFNLPYKDLTDLTLRRQGDKLILTRLTSDPLPKSTLLAGGFGVENIEELNISDIEKAKNLAIERKWDYKGKTYRAKIDIKMEELGKSIVTTKDAPNYPSMWKDGEFRTVVVAGSNLGEQLTDSTMKEYVSYYTDQGFNLSAPKEIGDLPKYLQEKAKGQGQMDMFIKEAHSDGDEKNLFRISQRAKIIVGKKKTPKGDEVVEIVYPISNDGGGVHISNREFGEWMKKRDSKGGGELLYLNSSCWSKSKAVYEIGAAATDKLLNIPTTTMMSVFQNRPKNVMKLALDGIRSEKTFSDIRQNLRQDEGYASGDKNVFIFPDEERYKEEITRAVAKPLNIKMDMEQLSGSTWSRYSIEDHGK